MSKLACFVCLVFFAMNAKRVHSGNILFFNGMGEGSHFTAASAVAEELVSKGHSVTFVVSSVFKFRLEHPVHSKLFTFRVVNTNESLENVSKRFEPIVDAIFDGAPLTTLFQRVAEAQEHHFVPDCRRVFQPEFLQSVKDSAFDVVVYDPSWPCTSILAEYITANNFHNRRVSTVAILPPAIVPTYLRIFGNPLNPAYTPESGSGLPVVMSFYQRILNLLQTSMQSVMVQIPTGYDQIRAEVGVTGGMLDTFRNTSLLLSSADPVIDQRIPTMPGHILVGGLTVTPAKALATDLEEFMQSSGEHGVIIFSLGSYVTHLPEKYVKLFQDAFSRIPQKVIWQWKNKENPTNMPSNVKPMAWLPQNDLLGHNKTRLLFYQGGNNGLYEAIYHAVPLLVLPFFGDQPDVAQRVVEREVGLKLDVTTVTSDSVVKSITTILTDPKYQVNSDVLSEIFRDRPDSPRERAAFWIEHILKHGADHIRSPVHDLNFIELNMLDVYGFLLACLLSICYIFYRTAKFLFWCLCSICCRRKTKTD